MPPISSATPIRPAQPSRNSSTAQEPATPSGTAQAMWMNETLPTRVASEEASVITSPAGWSSRAPRSIRRYLASTRVRSSAVIEWVVFHVSDHWCLCATESIRWKPPRAAAISRPSPTNPRAESSNQATIARMNSGPATAHASYARKISAAHQNRFRYVS